jgi:hypothetical protein
VILGRGVVAAVAVASVVATGCRSPVNGYLGDPPAPPAAREFGSGTHISSKLQNANGTYGFYGPADGWVQPANPSSQNCPYPPALHELVTGVTVTAVDRWDETCNGAVGTVYVQDSVGLDDWTQIPIFAGMSMFDPTFSPPDLRVLPGDVLDMTGQYEEFVGPSTGAFSECETLPQIAGSAAFRFDGRIPPPVQIQPSDLATFEGARQYLGMLVTVNNLTVGATGVEKSGRYSADVQVDGTTWQISDELFDVPDVYPLTLGQTFQSVTGIVTFFYSYHLAPRSLDDFTLMGGGHPSLPPGGVPDHCASPPPKGMPDAGAPDASDGG